MAPNARVQSAFQAMRELEISEDVVRPVLKQLLRVYDKNWELIEADNYRTLADAVFEYQETNVANQKRKPYSLRDEDEDEEDTLPDEEPERPLKRSRMRPQVGQDEERLSVSRTKISGLPERPSTSLNPLVEREKDIAAQPVIANGAQMYANAMNAIRSSSDSTAYFKDKGKRVVCEAPAKENRQICKSPSLAIRLKEPKTEPGIPSYPAKNGPKTIVLIQPKEEPVVDCATNATQSEIPNSDSREAASSLSGEGFEQKNGELRTPVSLSVNEGHNEHSHQINTYKSTVFNHAGTPKVSSLELESASSPLGVVKISLSFTVSGQTNGNMPSLDAVLRLVEEKCARLYNINSNFSVKQIIKDMCESLLELGSKPVEKSQKSNSIRTPPCTKQSPNAGRDNGHSVYVSSPSTETVRVEMVMPKVLETPCMGARSGQIPHADNGINSNEDHDNEREVNGNDYVLSRNMAVVVADEITSIYHANVADEEGVAISLMNDVNSISFPSFKYIPHSIVYENAYLKISLAQIGNGDCCKECVGDCLKSKIPCECASKSGGSYAYTLDGLLKEDFLEDSNLLHRTCQKHLQFCSKNCPLLRSSTGEVRLCKGHLDRKFIKECWKKCGCNKLCGNRLTQRGITRNLQVFMTPDGKGWGLRTLEDLPKGAFVCEYAGEILTIKEMHSRFTHCDSTNAHPVVLDANWGSEKMSMDERGLCLDGTDYGNIARFINHRCSDSNLIDIPVEVESPDHNYYHVAFFTRREVKAMEELTWDYGMNFENDTLPIKAFQCQCGSQYCRDMKRSYGSTDAQPED